MPGFLKRSECTLVNSHSDIKATVKELLDGHTFAFDLENDGDTKEDKLNPFKSTIGSLQFANKSNNFYLPLESRGGSLKLRDIIPLIRPLFDTDNTTIIGHNLKFDIEHLIMGSDRCGDRIDVNANLIDTMVADWLLGENERRHSLEMCAKRELGIDMIKFEDAEATPPMSDDRIRYGCDDVRVPWKLWYEVYWPRIKKEKLEKVFHELEMPYISCIIEMELNGMKLDVPVMEMLFHKYVEDLTILEDEIHKHAGQHFLLTSPAQVSRVLFQDMGFKPKRGMEKNKSGNWPTGREVLEKYKGENPIFDDLLAFRKISKLQTGFVKPLIEKADKFDGRIRSSFQQTGTVSGRLSSKSPNLMNIPREKNAIRDAFIASEGWLILMADFSQLELRLMAHFSQDPSLLRAYNEKGLDVHQMTADECGCSRQDAKIINFGVIYGMSPQTLAQFLGISVSEAERYHKAYFKKYKGVKDFHKRVWNTLDQKGYVTLLTGRRRRFPEWHTLGNREDWWKKSMMHRQAVNSIIQGSGADLIKISQRNIMKRVRNESIKAIQCSQVHDEVIMEVIEAQAKYLLDVVEHEMSNCVKLRVPLEAEGKIGKSWGHTKS